MNVLIGILKDKGIVNTMWVAANSYMANCARNASAGFVMLIDVQ